MRCTRRHKHSKIPNQTMGVSPEVIFNVNDRSLAVIGHEYLSRNENYIRPNRTALRSYKERLPEKSGIDAGSNIVKQFSERLLT
ncbi:unnamed protein product [Rotaria magnacalcarata]|uniref:Uncharacterized protein n=1 Tax=Rotaria magnacalcarata TaxID=392030 RepID=A0A8S3HVQ4_9BILA|nr:unnamed protein product [Rotaria magnacalcarata]CAF5199217.1 unnamed protein product [Rotaria magnacalcarata]